jgi:outer membrane protein assembly factor BamB
VPDIYKVRRVLVQTAGLVIVTDADGLVTAYSNRGPAVAGSVKWTWSAPLVLRGTAQFGAALGDAHAVLAFGVGLVILDLGTGAPIVTVDFFCAAAAPTVMSDASSRREFTAVFASCSPGRALLVVRTSGNKLPAVSVDFSAVNVTLGAPAFSGADIVAVPWKNATAAGLTTVNTTTGVVLNSVTVHGSISAVSLSPSGRFALLSTWTDRQGLPYVGSFFTVATLAPYGAPLVPSSSYAEPSSFDPPHLIDPKHPGDQLSLVFVVRRQPTAALRVSANGSVAWYVTFPGGQAGGQVFTCFSNELAFVSRLQGSVPESVIALNLNNGTVRWKAEGAVEDAITLGTVTAVPRQRAFVLAGRQTTWLVDAVTGDVLLNLGTPPAPFPVPPPLYDVYDSCVFIATASGEMAGSTTACYAFTTADQYEAPIFGRPRVAYASPDALVLATIDTYASPHGASVFGVDPRTSAGVWSSGVLPATVSNGVAIVIGDRVVTFTAYAVGVQSLETGALLGVQPLPLCGVQRSAIHPETAFAAGDYFVAAGKSGCVYWFNAASMGPVRVGTTTAAGVGRVTAGLQGPVIVTTLDSIKAFSRDTPGTGNVPYLMWEMPLATAGVSTQPVVYGAYVYAVTALTTLYCFAAATGEGIFRYDAPSTLFTGIAAAQGNVYLQLHDRFVVLAADPAAKQRVVATTALQVSASGMAGPPTVDVPFNVVLTVTPFGLITAYDMTSGARLWSRGTSNQGVVRPGAGRLAVFAKPGSTGVALLDLRTGGELAAYPLPKLIPGPAPGDALIVLKNAQLGDQFVFLAQMESLTGGPDTSRLLILTGLPPCRPFQPLPLVPAPTGPAPPGVFIPTPTPAPVPAPGVARVTLGCVSATNLRLAAFSACAGSVLLGRGPYHVVDCNAMVAPFADCVAEFAAATCPAGVAYLGTQLVAELPGVPGVCASGQRDTDWCASAAGKSALCGALRATAANASGFALAGAPFDALPPLTPPPATTTGPPSTTVPALTSARDTTVAPSASVAPDTGSPAAPVTTIATSTPATSAQPASGSPAAPSTTPPPHHGRVTPRPAGNAASNDAAPTAATKRAELLLNIVGGIAALLGVAAVAATVLYCRERRKRAAADGLFDPSADRLHSMALFGDNDPAAPLRDGGNDDGAYEAPTV